MVTNQPKDGHTTKEVQYRLGIWHLHILTKLTPGDNCHEWSPIIHRMVTHQPKDGHPPTLGWSPTRRKCTIDLEFGTYTLLTKLTPGDSCHGWSPAIPQRVTQQPKDDWSPTREKCSRALEFGTNRLLAKLAPGDSCH